MSRRRLPALSEAELAFVREKTLWTLEHVGVAVPSPRGLRVLERGGADVDHERQIARISPALVDHCLASAPRTALLAARDPARDITLGAGGRLVCCSDGEATLVADDDTGHIRDATVADMYDVCRLADALPEFDFLWTSLASPALDPVTGPLLVDAIALRASSKHLQSVSPKTPDQVPALVAMLEAVAGASLAERPIYSFLHCTVAPLMHDPEVTEANLDIVGAGGTICVTSMPQMGSTAPMSVLGLCVVVLAELLSGVVLFQLAHPGSQVVVEPMPCVTDMRTGQYLGGAPEVGVANGVCVELCRALGLPTIGSGSTSDANGVDYQAASESMLLWLSVAEAGADGLVAGSFFNGSRVYSPAKAVLDADALGTLHRYLEGPELSDEAALLDDLAAVGPGGHFLGRRSTRARTRAGELFEPRVFHRERLGDAADATLVADAAARARHLLATHEVAPLPDEAERAIDAAIESYRATH